MDTSFLPAAELSAAPAEPALDMLVVEAGEGVGGSGGTVPCRCNGRRQHACSTGGATADHKRAVTAVPNTRDRQATASSTHKHAYGMYGHTALSHTHEAASHAPQTHTCTALEPQPHRAWAMRRQRRGHRSTHTQPAPVGAVSTVHGYKHLFRRNTEKGAPEDGGVLCDGRETDVAGVGRRGQVDGVSPGQGIHHLVFPLPY